MSWKTLLLLSLASLVPALATKPLQRRAYSPDEHLVLGDCGVDASRTNSKSRYMFYYAGDLFVKGDTSKFSPPTMRTEVPWDGSYPWRSSGVSAKFPNGDIFLVRIEDTSSKDNMFGNVGSATHIYDPHPFRCYAWHKPNLDTLPDGTKCESAYICYHDDDAEPTKPTPAPTPKPTATFKYTAYKEKVELEGKWRAGDIFKWTQFASGDDYCDEEAWIPLPGSSQREGQCMLNVQCGPGKARGIVRAIANILDKHEEFMRTYTKKIEPSCEDKRSVCMAPGNCIEQCMKWGPSEKVVTEVSTRGRGDLLGLPDGQINVQYKIRCPGVDEYDRCDVCQGVGGLLSGAASLISSPLGLFGSVMTFGICGSSSC
jgi:hypothetical protein